jgi:hypothetical protein
LELTAIEQKLAVLVEDLAEGLRKLNWRHLGENVGLKRYYSCEVSGRCGELPVVTELSVTLDSI